LHGDEHVDRVLQPRACIEAGESREAHEQRGEDQGQDEVATVQPAPYHVGPVGTVPQAAQQEHDHQVVVPTPFHHAVAAQGDVQVIAEPAAEADVPAAPEFTDRGAAVWRAAVHHQVEPHHACGPESNVRVAAEIAIDLDGEEIGGQGDGKRAIVVRVAVHLVHHHGTAVRDHHLFEEAPQHLSQAPYHADPVEVGAYARAGRGGV